MAAAGLGIDYTIRLARDKGTIAKRLVAPDFDGDIFLTELGKVLYQAIGDFGIKTLPDKTSEDRITHYILSYYKDFTLQDIQLAFELAIAGELEVSIEHYQSFDLKFICTILNSYRSRRNKALSALEKLKRQEEPPKEYSAEEQDRIRKDFEQAVCRQYAKFCETGQLGAISLRLVYELLVENGLLVLTEETTEAYRNNAIEQYKMRLSLPKSQQERRSFRTILEDFEKAIEGSEKFKIEELIREQAIKGFFLTCKHKNIDLSTIL